MTRCIWCKRENSDSAIEHIIPEALGCPADFTLAGGLVCRRCNNGLAHLDRAVIDDFDIPIFTSNIPRKKGRSPVIRSRGNMVGTYGKGGPKISINMERYPVISQNGTVLGAFGRSDRNINATLLQDGANAEIKFSVPIGENPKFVRGIFKIGLSSLAYFLGGEIAQLPMFDGVREFVRNGTGARRVLMIGSDDKSVGHQVSPPCSSPSGYFLSVFRLVAVNFLVDLSPDHSLFPDLKKQLMQTKGTTGWTWLPSGDNNIA